MGYLQKPSHKSGFFILLSCLLISTYAYSHNDPDAQVPSLEALKTDQTIKVDGVLSEAFWQDCHIATDFHDTHTQKIAEQKTVVRIAYTESHLYIGVECFDDKMGEIHATERREDRYFRGDDHVEINIDPTHCHRAKYIFYCNPLGTKCDGIEGPSGQFNIGWTAEWDLAAQILDDRWVFEMSIPLTVMNFFKTDRQTWGLNFNRQVVRTDSRSYWSYNITESYRPRYFGHLTNLDLADSIFDRNLEITPYVSTRMDYNGETETFSQTGVDVSTRLTPSITSSWTINPDFGQVEADDDTIELRDTERFLTEKRRFFREGNELMSTPRQLYYSRRFTDIDTGANISGEWKDYKFSFLNIYGDATHSGTRNGNSSIFRALQNVGERSTLGYYLSTGEYEDGHSRVASMDGKLFLNDDWQYNFQASVADDRWEDGTGGLWKDSVDYLAFSSVRYQKYPWELIFGYNAITEEFDPMLGFIPRRDIFGPYFRLEYHLRSDEQWYKDYHVEFDSALYENEEDETVLRDYRFLTYAVFPNDTALYLAQALEFHIPYENTRTTTGFILNDSDTWNRLNFKWTTGEFMETPYDEFTLEKNFKPFEQLPIRYEYVVRFEEEPDGGEETIWLNRVIFDYYFTDKMWLKTSLQHRSESIHNVSVIYGWEFIPNAHWYLVYNSVDNGYDPKVESVFTKLAYTFTF